MLGSIEDPVDQPHMVVDGRQLDAGEVAIVAAGHPLADAKAGQSQ